MSTQSLRGGVRESWCDQVGDGANVANFGSMPTLARDLMQPDPITIAPSTPFLEIQHLFVLGEIGGAPVVDASGKVLGMISDCDLLRVMDQACDDEFDAFPSAAEPVHGPPLGSHELPEGLCSLTALDVLVPDVVWVLPDTPIARVAHIMRTEVIHRVLVGHEGRLAGILTTFDLLKALEE